MGANRGERFRLVRDALRHTPEIANGKWQMAKERVFGVDKCRLLKLIELQMVTCAPNHLANVLHSLLAGAGAARFVRR